MASEAPRQLPSGKWNYTIRVGKKVISVGYCADYPDGHHASEEEAEDCYRNYLKENIHDGVIQ